MPILRAPLFRPLTTVLLVVLLCVCGLMAKNLLVQGWRDEMHETDLFVRSPNCVTEKDSSEIDPSLPPCIDVSLTVAAKPERTDSDPLGHRTRPRVYRSLTLRDQYGRTWTVGDIYQDMWDSIKIGDPVSVKVWRGQIQTVSADGFNNPITDLKTFRHSLNAAAGWGMTGAVCLGLLGMMWGRYARRSDAFWPV